MGMEGRGWEFSLKYDVCLVYLKFSTKIGITYNGMQDLQFGARKVAGVFQVIFKHSLAYCYFIRVIITLQACLSYLLIAIFKYYVWRCDLPSVLRDCFLVERYIFFVSHYCAIRMSKQMLITTPSMIIYIL